MHGFFQSQHGPGSFAPSEFVTLQQFFHPNVPGSIYVLGCMLVPGGLYIQRSKLVISMGTSSGVARWSYTSTNNNSITLPPFIVVIVIKGSLEVFKKWSNKASWQFKLIKQIKLHGKNHEHQVKQHLPHHAFKLVNFQKCWAPGELIAEVKAKFAAEQQATSRRVELQESATPGDELVVQTDGFSQISQALFLNKFSWGSQPRQSWVNDMNVWMSFRWFPRQCTVRFSNLCNSRCPSIDTPSDQHGVSIWFLSFRALREDGTMASWLTARVHRIQ